MAQATNISTDLSSSVDDSTIEYISNKLQAKDGGITYAKLNADAHPIIEQAKLTAQVSTNSTTWVDTTGFTLTKTLEVGDYVVAIGSVIAGSAGNNTIWQILEGANVIGQFHINNSGWNVMNFCAKFSIATAGSTTVKLQWKVAAGTSYMVDDGALTDNTAHFIILRLRT